MTSLYAELTRVVEAERERDRPALASVRAAVAARRRRGSEPRFERLLRGVARAFGREGRMATQPGARVPTRSVASGDRTTAS